MAEFNEKLHPREPKGDENGGQFTDVQGVISKIIRENRSYIYSVLSENFEFNSENEGFLIDLFSSYIQDKGLVGRFQNTSQVNVELKTVIGLFKRDLQIKLDVLNVEKLGYIKRADELVKIKKSKYSNMDIESPMSIDEKQLDRDIAELFSKAQTIVKEKQKIMKFLKK